MSDTKLKLYRSQQAKRRAVCWAFFPVGFALMLGARWLLPDAGVVLVWPLLIAHMLATVIGLQQLDHCPWCRKSFHKPAAGASVVGFSALLRANCANCGMPEAGKSQAGGSG